MALHAFRRLDLHHLVVHPVPVLLRHALAHARGVGAAEAEVRPLFIAAVVGVVGAGGVEGLEEMPAAGARLGRRQQHVGVVLDGLGHALRQRGGEFAALLRVQLSKATRSAKWAWKAIVSTT
jgi:hypothetical protein